MKPKAAWLGLSAPPLVKFEGGHLLHQQIVDDYLAMSQAARADGIDCQLVSSYRDFHRQRAIWNKKWLGQATLYDRYSRPLDTNLLNDDAKLHAILIWSALPGGSRHHWGTDIDVFDKANVSAMQHQFELVDSEYCPNGPCYDLSQWLAANCHSYGFVRPFETDNGGVAVEKWHLSHAEVASEFESERNLEDLADAIISSELFGKATVLQHLESIYHQYILNQGTQ